MLKEIGLSNLIVVLALSEEMAKMKLPLSKESSIFFILGIEFNFFYSGF